MRIVEGFNIVFNSLKSNKIRSLLTVSGVIIGVMAIILLVSVITGTKAKIEGEIISFGSNSFVIFPGNFDMSGYPGINVVNKLKERHIDLLEARSSYGVIACPEYDLMGIVVKYKRESRKSSMVIGVYANMPEVYNWKIAQGNFFKQEDVNVGRKTVVIGETIVKDFFPSGNANAIGKEISVKGIKFRIIGILESKGKMFDMDMDDIVVMPITTAHNLIGSTEIHQITLKVPNAKDVNKAVLETKRILKMEMEEKDFTVQSQSEMLGLFNTFANVLSVVTGVIAGISLLVAGIGIMNIMLVTVTERIKEIGLRKAVGATFYNILLQFLIESITITISGGLIGIILSIIIISTISPYVPFPLKASISSIILAFSFSTAIGVFFGVYPAVKAARIDPIVALKYE
ncbi:MAG: ABC transporter permease [Candidatus Firestonebacteria bacterium]